MNKLVLPAGPVWLASDLHLSASTPATQEAFLAFLRTAADEAAALLLPGDIFNAWIGDDEITDAEPWLAQALDGLKAAAARLPIYLGHGNRDFLMGRRLARALGAHLLPDTVLLKTAYGDVLLSHGDEYCTDDEAYQRWRRLSRNPVVQFFFLLRTLPSRKDYARRARERSMQVKKNTPSAIMDVNQEAVEKAFRKSGASLMVHGHTHRPARHLLTVDGRQCERWVLPDWDLDHATPARGGWLVIDADGPRLYDLESA